MIDSYKPELSRGHSYNSCQFLLSATKKTLLDSWIKIPRTLSLERLASWLLYIVSLCVPILLHLPLPHQPPKPKQQQQNTNKQTKKHRPKAIRFLIWAWAKATTFNNYSNSHNCTFISRTTWDCWKQSGKNWKHKPKWNHNKARPSSFHLYPKMSFPFQTHQNYRKLKTGYIITEWRYQRQLRENSLLFSLSDSKV